MGIIYHNGLVNHYLSTIPLDSTLIELSLVWLKSTLQHCPKKSVPGADGIRLSRLISDDFTAHKSVLQLIDLKATDLNLSFKPAKCISFLFDGAKFLSQGIALSKGVTIPITEGHTKFLGKVIDISLSAM